MREEYKLVEGAGTGRSIEQVKDEFIAKISGLHGLNRKRSADIREQKAKERAQLSFGNLKGLVSGYGSARKVSSNDEGNKGGFWNLREKLNIDMNKNSNVKNNISTSNFSSDMKAKQYLDKFDIFDKTKKNLISDSIKKTHTLNPNYYSQRNLNPFQAETGGSNKKIDNFSKTTQMINMKQSECSQRSANIGSPKKITGPLEDF